MLKNFRAILDPKPTWMEAGVRQALEYGPAFVGAGLWAFTKFPEQMRWAAGLYERSFGHLAGLYERWTETEGYGEALEEAMMQLRRPPGKVLDMATGTGFVATAIKRRFPDALVTGTDVAAEMVAIAQHQALADGLTIDYEIADSSALPFEDESFDLVTMQNSIPFPEEMMRVVAPGGRALIVYSFAGPWIKLAWPALDARLEAAGAEHVWGRRSGPGYYGFARKTGNIAT